MPRYDDLPFSPLPGRGATADDLFQAIVYHVFTTLRVAQPATVIAWTPPTPGNLPPTVDLLLDFKRARAVDNPSEVRVDAGETLITETAGLKAVGPYPPLRRVPIVSFGPPSFNIRGPIDVGTTGLYIIADRCLDQWLNSGGPLDPATADKHDINDGIFFPTVYHGKNTPVVPTDAHQLGPDDGTAAFEISTIDKSLRAFTEGPTANIDAATKVQLGDPLAVLLGVARLTDTTSADTQMAAWMAAVQVVVSAAAAFFALPVPVFPADFGVISSSSTKVESE